MTATAPINVASSSSTSSFTLKTALALAFTLIVWASAFVGVRATLSAYSPGELAFLRYATASLVLIAYLAIRRPPLPARSDWPKLALLGVVGITIYNLAMNAGEQRVTAGSAAFIVNTGPVLVAILATLFLHERLRVFGWVGILVSFCGTGVTAMGEGGGVKFEPAALLVFLAAVAQATFFVLQKPVLRRYSALDVTSYAIWTGTLFLLPFLPGTLQAVKAAPLNTTLAVVYLGIFPGALGYMTWSYVLARMPASRATSFLYFVPGITILIGWVWLGEVPSTISIIGGVIALGGVLLVNTMGREAS
jgi:drug/metabolite transporter (DMT)-like permease